MTNRPRLESLSPSLVSSADGESPAYEQKFLVTESQAAELEAWVASHLTPDPHADPTAGNRYRVTSVYLDTSSFDVCRRTEGYTVHKYRVRRYGLDSLAHLERKSKRSGRVWKQRTAIPLVTPIANTPVSWFADEVAELRLQPVCRISYDRTAFVGVASTGPIRLTLDRLPIGVKSNDFTLTPVTDGTRLVSDSVIVELKFLATSPLVFKELLETFRLNVCGVSKYRHCINALSLCASPGDDDA